MAQDFLDPYQAVLFDIDGTLLNCQDAVHYFAFCEALTRIAGRPLNLDGVVTHGNVDEGILRDALNRAGVPESHWRPLLREACDGMCRSVEAHAADLRMEILPGVTELLAHLKHVGKVLGTATGNLAGIGRTKLAECGLLPFFDFGGFSDTCETRAQVFAGALAEARSLTGPNARICVVGDTPADIRAAKENNLDVIAVATGIFSYETLAAEEPSLCLNTLRELLAAHA
jgi:phosphoglycolate phosphatase-like HAD superfamily hydrolase